MPLVPTSPGLSALGESDWKRDSQSCPLASFALHNKGSAEMLCPSPHVAHTKTIAVAACIESHAVVFEYEQSFGSAASETERSASSLGMPRHVGKRLARELDDLGRATAQACGYGGVDVDFDRRARSCLHFLAKNAQGLVQLPIGEDPRPKPEDVVAQIPDHFVELFDGIFDSHRHVR